MCRNHVLAATALAAGLLGAVCWGSAARAAAQAITPAVAASPAPAPQAVKKKATAQERADAERLPPMARAAFWAREVSVDPTDVVANVRLAAALRTIGQYSEAADAAQRALVIDPKNFSAESFVDRKVPVCIIPPNSFALTHTVEYFRIPRDILVVCLGKSTYARCGIIVNVTPLEPEWEGQVTIEISNTTPLPAKIYAFEGICQFLFFQGDQPCETSYADKAGKYMRQTGVSLPRMG